MKIYKNMVSRYNILKIAMVVLAIAVMPSCVKNDIDGGGTTGTGKEREVVFSFDVPGKPNTRALDEQQEYHVKSAEVLVFHPGGAFKRLEYAEYVDNDDANIYDKKFKVTLPEGTWDLIFLANSREWIEKSFLGSDADLNSLTRDGAAAMLKATLGNTANDKWCANSSDGAKYKHIPMWGEKTATISDGTELTDIKLVRMLARIDVILDGAQSNFKLNSVRLYNRNTEGYIMPKLGSGNWDASENKVLKSHIPAQNKVKGPLVYEDGEIVNGLYCKEEIYIFEAEKGKAYTESLLDYQKNTCLVIGGYFDKDNNTSNETFYRIDFAKGGNYIELLRNYHYEVKIKEIGVPGLTDPDEAAESFPADIDVEILGWNTGYTADNNLGESFTFDISSSFLEFIGPSGQDRVELKITTDHPDGWKFDKFSHVDSPDDPFFENDPDFIYVSNGSAVEGAQNVPTSFFFDLAPLYTGTSTIYYRKFYIHFTAGNYRHAVKVEMRLTKDYDDLSNCLMVPPGMNWMRIPVEKAYMVWENEFGMPLDEKYGRVSAQVLWNDVGDDFIKINLQNGDQGRHSFIGVEVGNQAGNAIVAVRVGNYGDERDPIRWSWHVWVTDYRPNLDGKVHEFGEAPNNYPYVFMDRNLGATTAASNSVGPEFTDRGLLYQWGRKDPFPRSSWSVYVGSTYGRVPIYPLGGIYTPEFADIDDALLELGRSNTLLYTIYNPHMFITSLNEPSWYDKNGNSSLTKDYGFLWDSGVYGKKTAFDPCPQGWGVPSFAGTRDNFSGLRSPWIARGAQTPYPASAYGGAAYNSDGIYAPIYDESYWPAPGIMTRDGKYTDVGKRAIYWTNTYLTDNTMDKYPLGLYIDNMNTYGGDDNVYPCPEPGSPDFEILPIYGGSVRCVKLLNGVIFGR